MTILSVPENKPRRKKAEPVTAHGAYLDFVSKKTQLESDHGFAPLVDHDFLFDFQKHLVSWALRKGRAGVFAECGLGKTPMQIAWADNVVRKTNKPVLILTPLAVSQQTVREGTKFGIEVNRSVDGAIKPGVNVTNYERLHRFNPDDFGGIVCDESGILKNFDGTTRTAIVRFMCKTPLRLLCSATPAPNDFYELGSSSEALGYLGFMDMLGRFFKNARNNASLGRAWATSSGKAAGGAPQWRFRGHAEKPFWRWVCSWSLAIRKPSDIGYDDGKFVLPPLVEREHVVRASKPRDGLLFSMPAVGLAEQRAERRNTLRERCEMVAQLVDHDRPVVAWCHLNAEGDLLEKLIPGAIQVSGKDSDDEKEEKFTAFTNGQARVLVTKPIIGAWGLNWQHCAHMTTFGSNSFEQHYQSVRRLYRFGQTREVVVDHVLSDGEESVLANLQRKTEQADKMFAELAGHIQEELAIQRGRRYEQEEEMPPWL